ncbi:FHA domain-containing protein [Denitromonas iodatirespirans]|uniref:FHA domain-containing protein n=1 Tax=Denitromonas iodatirespirans TaxID=2795389 RepID=A0A944HAK3_DENI1|nr:FHA domain-containing protein [Denitromonas iodatirespirans]MBT0960682.1 FHA domain-containing protein [Denitromonas iodatirespirans]
MIKVNVINRARELIQQLKLDDIALTNGAIIGRHPESSVHLGHTSVSHQHAKLTMANGKVVIEDLNSKYGTQANGCQLTPGTAMALERDAHIQVGVLTLKVESTNADQESNRVEVPEAELTEMMPPPPKMYQPVAMVHNTCWKAWEKGKIKVTCSRIIDETHDVKTFFFTATPNTLFRYKPGQFATLYLNIDGKPVARSYTLSSTPSRPHTISHTIKRMPAAEGQQPGMVSNWLHDNLKEGDEIEISGPYGEFSCHDYPNDKVCFISGGSGVTPMLSMTRWLLDTLAKVDIVFVHAAKTEADIVARQELEYYASRHPNLHLIFILSQVGCTSSWAGYRGRLNTAFMEMAVPDFKNRTLFVCGSQPFMQSVREQMKSCEFPMEHYHEESFGGPPAGYTQGGRSAPLPETPRYGLKAILDKLSTEPVRREKARSQLPTGVGCNAKDTGLKIEFSRTACAVPYSGGTLLDAAEGSGLSLPAGCRQGVCGVCKQKKTKGDLISEGYDDSVLSAEDKKNGYVLMCIAKPKSNVEIDA